MEHVVDPVRVSTYANGSLIDFGHECYARVILRISGRNAVRVWFGESASEATTHFRQVGWQAETHSVPLDPEAFRYVFLPEVLPEAIESVTAVDESPQWPLLGKFHCSEPMLDRIWQVGAETVRLCGGTVILDGIKRDRRPWMGDLAIAGRVVAAAFGPRPEVLDTANQLRDESFTDGLAWWMNDIPSYSLWWLIAQVDWRQLFGHDFTPQLPFLEATLNRIEEETAADGREQFIGWRFLDWATTAEADVSAGTQALLVTALISASELAKEYGRSDLAQRANCLRQRVRDAATDQRPSPVVTALRVLAGLEDPTAAAETFANTWAVRLTPFLGESLIRACSRTNIDAAIDFVIRYWGGMLARGATTWWEDFDLVADEHVSVTDPRTSMGGQLLHSGHAMSLCHAWSAGPTAWLTDTILGVRPASPGFGTVRVTPHLGRLRWAEGAVPTPHGVIRVRHERLNTQVETVIEVPDGVRLMPEVTPTSP